MPTSMNNAKLICNNTKLVGVTEMPINVHLLDSLIRSSMGRHGRILKNSNR